MYKVDWEKILDMSHVGKHGNKCNVSEIKNVHIHHA